MRASPALLLRVLTPREHRLIDAKVHVVCMRQLEKGSAALGTPLGELPYGVGSTGMRQRILLERQSMSGAYKTLCKLLRHLWEYPAGRYQAVLGEAGVEKWLQ